MRMNKTALKIFTAEIASKRREVTRMQEELGDLQDHLTVIEARAKSAGGKRHATTEIKKVMGI